MNAPSFPRFRPAAVKICALLRQSQITALGREPQTQRDRAHTCVIRPRLQFRLIRPHFGNRQTLPRGCVFGWCAVIFPSNGVKVNRMAPDGECSSLIEVARLRCGDQTWSVTTVAERVAPPRKLGESAERSTTLRRLVDASRFFVSW